MADLDLDAIAKRAERAKEAIGTSSFAYDCVTFDVPVLVVRVRELEAERDAAKRETEGYQAMCDSFYESDACALSNRVSVLEAALRTLIDEAQKFVPGPNNSTTGFYWLHIDDLAQNAGAVGAAAAVLTETENE